MIDNKRVLLKNYLSNIQVNLVVASYTHCRPGWREIDYIPEYNKFYYITDGEGYIRIGEKEFFPTPGQLVLMPHGIKQSFSSINNNTYKKYWCHFTATIGDTNLFDIIELPYYVEVKDENYLKNLFEQLINSYQSIDFTSHLNAKANLLKVISYFLDNTIIEKIFLSSSYSVEKLSYVLNYIEKDISKNYSIEELSNIVHVHPNYFIKLFKAQLGSTPMQYINKLKLEKAKRLLESSSLNITEISEQTGFNDIFYFSKTFKGYTGFSPSEFRNINNSYKKNE